MTVNEYLPGQGIASHVDSHDAFSTAIFSLSLASGVVMDFRHCPGYILRADPSAIRQASLLPPSFRNCADSELAPNTTVELKQPDATTDDDAARLLLWLPPRSLLVLDGESR